MYRRPSGRPTETDPGSVLVRAGSLVLWKEAGMSREPYTPEQIIRKLREAKVLLGKSLDLR